MARKLGVNQTYEPPKFNVGDNVEIRQNGNYLIIGSLQKYEGHSGFIVGVYEQTSKYRKFSGSPLLTRIYSVYSVKLSDGEVVNNVSDFALVLLQKNNKNLKIAKAKAIALKLKRLRLNNN